MLVDVAVRSIDQLNRFINLSVIFNEGERRSIKVLLSMLVYLTFLTVPAVYIILSFIFLRKPTWLRKQRRPAFIARNIAHRGGKIITT